MGAIAGLVNATAAADHAYDAVSGVSGGAINAVMLASYAKGDESSAVTRMLQFWKDAANTDLYKNWFGGVVRGLFFEGGVYNSAPLEDFLKKEFKDVEAFLLNLIRENKNVGKQSEAQLNTL